MGSRGQSVFSVLFLNLKVMFRSILPSPFVLHWFVREKIYCHWKGINDTRNFHSLELYGTENIWEGRRFLRAIRCSSISTIMMRWWVLAVVYCLMPAAAHILAVCPDTTVCLNISTITSDPSLLSPKQVFLGNWTWILAFSRLFLASPIDYRRLPYPLGRRQSILLSELPVSTEDRSQLGRSGDRWSVLGEARVAKWGHALQHQHQCCIGHYISACAKSIDCFTKKKW